MANWFTEGARADVSKVISANPAFQLQHSFALGAQGGKYNFGAIWTNNSVCLPRLYQEVAAGEEVMAGKMQ